VRDRTRVVAILLFHDPLDGYAGIDDSVRNQRESRISRSSLVLSDRWGLVAARMASARVQKSVSAVLRARARISRRIPASESALGSRPRGDLPESPRCPVTFHGSGKIQRLRTESGNAWCVYCSPTRRSFEGPGSLFISASAAE
jgi:hypothetical protein